MMLIVFFDDAGYNITYNYNIVETTILFLGHTTVKADQDCIFYADYNITYNYNTLYNDDILDEDSD